MGFFFYIQKNTFHPSIKKLSPTHSHPTGGWNLLDFTFLVSNIHFSFLNFVSLRLDLLDYYLQVVSRNGNSLSSSYSLVLYLTRLLPGSENFTFFQHCKSSFIFSGILFLSWKFYFFLFLLSFLFAELQFSRVLLWNRCFRQFNWHSTRWWM